MVASVPGIRPGEATAEYIDFILTRLTVIGAIYLSAVCLLPELLISRYAVPFYLGGTSLLISFYSYYGFSCAGSFSFNSPPV